jgi:hypothetical protein
LTEFLEAARSRRAMLKSAFLFAGGLAVASCTERAIPRVAMRVPPAPVPVPAAQAEAVPAGLTRRAHLPAPRGVRPELYERALAALDKHSGRVTLHDRIAIADFTSDSSTPRFHFVDLGTGQVQTLLVAHGSGSDPAHTGMLHRFSNDMGSNATCEGAFLATDYYVGQHGQSQRLIGLDPTNNNALDRAIVVHSAWYANPDMIEKHGKLGRSQGCFAVGERDLAQVFQRLGQGRMIYASRA